MTSKKEGISDKELDDTTKDLKQKHNSTDEEKKKQRDRKILIVFLCPIGFMIFFLGLYSATGSGVFRVLYLISIAICVIFCVPILYAYRLFGKR